MDDMSIKYWADIKAREQRKRFLFCGDKYKCLQNAHVVFPYTWNYQKFSRKVTGHE